MADHPLCCIAVLQSFSMRLGSGDRRLATRACNLVRMPRQRPRVSGRKSKPNTAGVAQPRPSRTAALTEVWNWPSIRRQLGLSRECPMAIVRSPAAFPKSARRELPLNPRRRHAQGTNKGRYHRPSVRQVGPAAMRGQPRGSWPALHLSVSSMLVLWAESNHEASCVTDGQDGLCRRDDPERQGQKFPMAKTRALLGMSRAFSADPHLGCSQTATTEPWIARVAADI